jgi:putative transposase
VHLIRASLRYVPRRDYDAVTKDLRVIYTAIDADRALHALGAFEAKWGQKFPPVVKAWRDAWEHVIPFLEFPPEVRRVIYTTDESVKAAARFWGSGLCRAPVLVAEVGGCEGVARRQGCRRNRVRMVSWSGVGVRDPRPEGALLAGGGVGG